MVLIWQMSLIVFWLILDIEIYTLFLDNYFLHSANLGAHLLTYLVQVVLKRLF